LFNDFREACCAFSEGFSVWAVALETGLTVLFCFGILKSLSFGAFLNCLSALLSRSRTLDKVEYTRPIARRAASPISKG